MLDKTGTVTEGRPQVTDLLAVPGVDENTLLSAAVAVEQLSEHPLAAAILRCAGEKGICVPAATGFETIPGQGVAGDTAAGRVLAGNLRMMEANGLRAEDFAVDADRLADEGKTPLYFALAGRPLGVIAAADVVKPTSRQAIEELRAMGIDRGDAGPATTGAPPARSSASSALTGWWPRCCRRTRSGRSPRCRRTAARSR